MNTNTHCPYCSAPQIGQSRYLYRFINIDAPSATQDRLKAVEIYCAQCNKTISIVPFMQ